MATGNRDAQARCRVEGVGFFYPLEITPLYFVLNTYASFREQQEHEADSQDC